MVTAQQVVLVLFLTYIYGTFSGDAWQSYYLDSFIFIPVLGDCYQLHHHNNFTDTCRREPDLETQSCIQWTSDDHNCLGLKTPTNETIVFRCTSHIRYDKCYEIYSADSNSTLVCQEIFHGHGVGITTPDNFTVVLHDSFCRTASNTIERQVYANFVNSFVLDADARSCYKVYTPEEVVTPYNCLSKDIYESCVFNTSEGCTALTTQNNEVIILNCPGKIQQLSQENCFQLYTFDNQVHTVCQTKLEERCVGVVTPSNLTVLFECFFCSDFMKITYYNHMKQKIQRSWVKNYLQNEYLGRNSHLLDSYYKVFNKDLPYPYIYPYWILDTSCMGIALDSNEIIILDCMVEHEKSEQKGCFSLITPESEKQSICAKVLSEECVGLVTPNNWSVALACFDTDWNSKSSDYGQGRDHFLEVFSDFLNNKYKFSRDHSYYLTNVNENSTFEAKEYQIQSLEGQPNCTGLQTETEIIVLDCTDRKMNGCFNVISSTNVSSGKEVNSEKQVNDACVKVLDNGCIGIVTPNNWRLTLYCRPPEYYPASSSGRPAASYPARLPESYPVVSFLPGSIPDNVPVRMIYD